MSGFYKIDGSVRNTTLSIQEHVVCGHAIYTVIEFDDLGNAAQLIYNSTNKNLALKAYYNLLCFEGAS